MAAKKKQCVAGHDPQSNCGACGLHCCNITPERGQEITLSARSGTNWADVTPRGSACVCGMRNAPQCYRHPEKGKSS